GSCFIARKKKLTTAANWKVRAVLLHSLYSYLRARMGSTLVARRAGRYVARPAATATKQLTANRVIGSVGFISNSRLPHRRLIASAQANPIPRPRLVKSKASFITK